MISDQKKTIQQTHYCNGLRLFATVKSFYYINQTLCRVILPSFEKPFLSAGESEHEIEGF